MVTAIHRRARDLRNSMTEPEVWLWGRLKRLHAQGYHFRRQRPFRGYYLDFVCIDRLVVVELDGAHHNEGPQLHHDAVRDSVLQRAGFVVLRFENHEVRQDIDRVMDVIVRTLEERPAMRGQGRPPGARRRQNHTPPP